MAIFPTLSTGAVLQYPTEQLTTQGVRTIRFLDGTDQRFLTQGRMLRLWQIRLTLLTDSEIAALEAFFLQQDGNYSVFSFPDPFTGNLVPNCRFGSAAFVSEYLDLQDNSSVMWVEEVNV